MNIDLPTPTDADYVERLQQAVRVMEGLSDSQRANFNILVIAVPNETGISACIAGLCGFDPWFQARGLITTLSESGGHINQAIPEFFGTEQPFYRHHYRLESSEHDVTVDKAIEALKQAIDSFQVARESAQPV